MLGQAHFHHCESLVDKIDTYITTTDKCPPKPGLSEDGCGLLGNPRVGRRFEFREHRTKELIAEARRPRSSNLFGQKLADISTLKSPTVG